MSKTLQFLPIALFCIATTAAAQSLQDRMLQAEDARPTTEAGLAPLIEGLKGNGRRTAIRAIGRLERPEMIELIAPALSDGVGIRAEAANALAQMARTPAAVVEVQKLLLARAAIDASLNTWESWGEIAAALGRLPYDTGDQVQATEAVLLTGLPAPDSMNDIESAALVGSARGFESLARTVRARKLPTLGERTWDLLRWAATAQRPAADPRSALTRRLAMAALVTGNQATTSVIERGLNDADAEVRRFAAVAAATDARIDERDRVIKIALADKEPRVRLEALRAWGRHFQKTSCAPVIAALSDSNIHVKLQAIDQLAAPCPVNDSLDALTRLAAEWPAGQRTWHVPAHALVSVAHVRPEVARSIVASAAQHPTWQVRMYAARAAGIVSSVDQLTTLLADPNDNVREAALSSLIDLKRPEAVSAALASLTRPNYFLILTAVRALEDKSNAPKALTPLMTALARITRENRDTSRDPRMAILNRLEAYGDSSQAIDLEAYARDFDPAIAQKAAEILTAWTGKPHAASPQPLPRPGVTMAMATALRGKSLRFHMAGRGHFDVGLDPDFAPLTAIRITRRAGEGYYDGLTFHRIAPNFVIQGGSPGANEYMGEQFYMRDEPGLHLRGTVGISTRGRDTGDAQIFVNLIDSPRLDHIYTVFGTIVAGMDVVDGTLEGDVIERVELVNR
ncbi:MAG TPA: peptidylprolyl isomerase [Vicinamibacterales bacterium]|nr:peptidylprolyl isomerase [Vicinamibacterales bacterium]